MDLHDQFFFKKKQDIGGINWRSQTIIKNKKKKQYELKEWLFPSQHHCFLHKILMNKWEHETVPAGKNVDNIIKELQ